MNGMAAIFTGLTVYAVLNLIAGLLMMRRDQRKAIRVSTCGTTTYIKAKCVLAQDHSE